jgi:site-specific DNA recombinase
MEDRQATRRCAIYARVSSDQQAKDGTIASQLAALKQRVADEGQTLEEEFCFLDEGCSGSTLIRPGLERLRDAAAAGILDRVYVHSPDRLARNYAYQVLLVDELRRRGVELVFLNQPLGTTPEENLLLQVQGVISEYERAKIMERSRRGKRHAARRGSLSVLGGAPYGYRYLPASAGGEAAWEIVAEEAQVVRRIFQWVGRDGLSIGAVARRLMQAQIASPAGKKRWGRSTVAGILKNSAYRGQAIYGKTRVGPRRVLLRPLRGRGEIPRRVRGVYRTSPEEQEPITVPPLVGEELFAAVAEQLAQNRRRCRGREHDGRFLLRGLTVCQTCGSAYVGTQRGKNRYYRCTGTDAFRTGERLCQNRMVRCELLDEAVWHDIRELLVHPQRLREEYQRRWASPEAAPLQTHQAEINKLRRAIGRLIDVYEEGGLEKPEFMTRVERARDRLRRLETELARQQQLSAQREQMTQVIGQWEDFAHQVQTGLASADFAQRREITRSLVKQIEIGPHKVRIVYKVTPPPFDRGPARGQVQDCPGRGPAMFTTRRAATRSAVTTRLARVGRCFHAIRRANIAPWGRAPRWRDGG